MGHWHSGSGMFWYLWPLPLWSIYLLRGSSPIELAWENPALFSCRLCGRFAARKPGDGIKSRSSTSKGRVSCLANWGDQQWRQDCHQEILVLTQQTWGFASMNSGLSCDPRPPRPKRHEIWHTSHWPPTASPARSHLAPLREMFCVFAESGPQTYFTPWSWGVYPT